MEHGRIEGFILEEKPVYDWNQAQIGTVVDMRRDPRTKEAKALVVALTADAQRAVGGGDLLAIPLGHVFAIRKDSVTLDRTLTELRKAEQLAPVK